MLLQIINHTLSLLIAGYIGVRSFKRMDSFKKILFIQLIVWIAFYVISHLITSSQIYRGIPEDNQWVYNISTFLEISILMAAAGTFYKDITLKRLVAIAYVLFVLLTFVMWWKFGFKEFNINAYVPGSLIVCVLYSVILHDCFFTNKNSPRLWNPDIWICIGLLVYFACNLPYFSLFHYLNKHHLGLSKILFNLITQVLANIRYLLLGLGFWLTLKKPGN
jgi:hypothetical protein